MRGILWWTAAAAMVVIPASSWGQQEDSKPAPAPQAQTSSAASAAGTSTTAGSSAPQQESLAEAARKAREAKKDQAKPAKVFDNDNLPGGAVSTVAKTDDAKKDGADASDDKSKPTADSEKVWREKFATLRSKLARDKEDLEVMQRELGVLNLQNYSDPNKGLQQELTRSDINDKTAAIDAKQKTIEADQQAIDDAEEDLRKAGGDSGWAR
jgi:chromosome segregation ATPase